MQDSPRTIETIFNIALGECLRRTTSHWKGAPQFFLVEQTGTLKGHPGKHPDILILDDESPPITVECSFDGNDADVDAISRLGEYTAKGNLLIQTSIAVRIPSAFRSRQFDQMRKSLREQAPIYYSLHQLLPDKTKRRWPTSGFLVGSIFDLAALVPAVALPKESVEDVASSVAHRIRAAADWLGDLLTPQQQRQIARTVRQRNSLNALRTAMVLWLNALLTQQRLARQGVRYSPSIAFSKVELPSPVDQASFWKSIADENWGSIFHPAISVLNEVNAMNLQATSYALHELYQAVELVEISRLGLHINVGAELFPLLSDDRKQAAAFYTTPATAELLASLTIKLADLEPPRWHSKDLFRHVTLADLACGTGTLLRAGYRRTLRFHEESGVTASSVAEFHKCAMESGLVGTDVSAIAAHLSTSSLAALGSGEPYGNTRIGWVEVGGSRATTGSLEYLGTDHIRDLFAVVAGSSSGSNLNSNAVEVRNESLDWVLMNPPYSRTRGGQSAFDIAGLSERQRKACQRRWREITRHEPLNNQAGMAASFLALARKKVRCHGRIGFVLPLTAAFADTWTQTRSMIEREFEQIVALSVVGGGESLSADTGIEEMLLIATKSAHSESNNSNERQRIHCVTLLETPSRVGEASEVARAIDETIARMGTNNGEILPIRAGDTELGYVLLLNCEREGDPWQTLGISHADLALATIALGKGKVQFGDFETTIGVGMTTIGELFDVGPTHDLIGHLQGRSRRGAFEFHPIQGPRDTLGRDRALWAADANSQKRMVVKPTHKGMAPSGVGTTDLRKRIRESAAKLHYARNIRWTSQALLSATTQTSVLGGSTWTTLSHDDERVCKAFALWANSTLGMITHWSRGQRTQLGRSRVQVGAIAQIPCPRFEDLSGQTLDCVVASFNELAKKNLLPACQSHIDVNRTSIDSKVIELLDLPEKAKAVSSTLRSLWCHEPSVHGKNQAALRLLSESLE